MGCKRLKAWVESLFDDDDDDDDDDILGGEREELGEVFRTTKTGW